MSTPQFQPRAAPRIVPMSLAQLNAADATPKVDWLWHGLIARGHVTLLTSAWRAGKTTLITGLLQQFAAVGAFLDRPVRPAKLLVVSDESEATWAERLRRMPVGEHCQLIAHPFRWYLTREEWQALFELATEMRSAGNLDLLVLDSLEKLRPRTIDDDSNGLEFMVASLRSLIESGVGVLILSRPRAESAEKRSARSQAGRSAADIVVELSNYGPMDADECRRKLLSVSRFPETPRRLVYEWDRGTSRFHFLGDPLGVRFHENLEHLHAALKRHRRPATPHELLKDWPADVPRPSRAALYEWLKRAHEENRVRRLGTGRRGDAFRYGLANEGDVSGARRDPPSLRADARERTA